MRDSCIVSGPRCWTAKLSRVASVQTVLTALLHFSLPAVRALHHRDRMGACQVLDLTDGFVDALSTTVLNIPEPHVGTVRL